jgi:hypothetical protein
MPPIAEDAKRVPDPVISNGEARDEAAKTAIESIESGAFDDETLRRNVRWAVGRIVSHRTYRRSMIVPVVMEA